MIKQNRMHFDSQWNFEDARRTQHSESLFGRVVLTPRTQTSLRAYARVLLGARRRLPFSLSRGRAPVFQPRRHEFDLLFVDGPDCRWFLAMVSQTVFVVVMYGI